MNDNHAAMDDMADFSQGRTWAPYIPRGCDQQGRLVPTLDQREGGALVDTAQPMPAEACTSLGFEAEPCKKARMGRLASWERWALTLGPGLLGGVASVFIVCFAIGSRYA